VNNFRNERKDRILKNENNVDLLRTRDAFLRQSVESQYSYNFDWLSRPIIQYPQDIVAVQELIWSVQPDLIIETGIAHGGSLILSASILALLDMQDATDPGTLSSGDFRKRKVVGIDVDIRQHNRVEIEKHFLSSYIKMYEGSSTDKKVFESVKKEASKYNNIMVFLDSNHTHKHVLNELKVWTELVSKDSYCVVFDTIIADLPQSTYPDRNWGPLDNPKTAVTEFLESTDDFVIDQEIENKILLTVAPSGYLKKIK
jgi:cephalosporin hydroxylase